VNGREPWWLFRHEHPHREGLQVRVIGTYGWHAADAGRRRVVSRNESRRPWKRPPTPVVLSAMANVLTVLMDLDISDHH